MGPEAPEAPRGPRELWITRLQLRAPNSSFSLLWLQIFLITRPDKRIHPSERRTARRPGAGRVRPLAR